MENQNMNNMNKRYIPTKDTKINADFIMQITEIK